MKSTILLNSDTHIDTPQVAGIGFFDGVHKGHQFLIRSIVEEARHRSMESMVISFDRHPRQVLNDGYVPQLLCTNDDKQLLISHTDVDNMVILPFDKEMSMLSAEDFMRDVLAAQLGVKVLVLGYDNHFGHRGEKTEGFADYVRYGSELGIEVIQWTPLTVGGQNVSSSLVRKYVSEGEVEMAERCLGRPYKIQGTVVGGFQEGRKLGFPTANIDPSSVETMIPAPGVYAVKVRVEGTVADRRAMMNIGTRPTFDGHGLSLEVHIFDFSDDLYGKTISVAFCHRLREERKFDSPEELAEQLSGDMELLRKQFDKDIEE